MFKKILFVSGVLLLALVILLVSIFNSSAVTYSITGTAHQDVEDTDIPKIEYPLPYMGNILPDSPLWGLKALRDRVWYTITASPTRKAELALLFADKRLLMSQELFRRGEVDLGVSTFTKAEKYLEIAVEEEKSARSQGLETSEFLERLATSSLKHREVAKNLIQLAPEEAKPLISKMENYAVFAYEAARNALNSKDLPVPKNPFDRD